MNKSVDLRVSCRGLKDTDFFSKSDPFLVLNVCNKSNPASEWMLIGQTSVQKNTLDPDFTETLSVNFFFEAKQECHFKIFDFDSNSKHELLGECYLPLSSIVSGSSAGKSFKTHLTLKGKQLPKSQIIIQVDTLHECNESLYMEWMGQKLSNVDGFFSKSDPFLRFLRLREDNSTFSVVQETECVKNELNPTWSPIEIPISKLCNADLNRPVKIECYDWEKTGKHQLIGECSFTVNELVVHGKQQFTLLNSKKKGAGTLILNTVQYKKHTGFLEYLQQGLQINMMLAVDFTASNGNINDTNSLHSISQKGALNQYEEVILRSGEILLDYDTDKKIPCFGFGGIPRNGKLKTLNNAVSHCFPLSGDMNAIEVQGGINAILSMYRQSLMSIEMSGPTYFGPIVAEAIRVASFYIQKGIMAYSVLLIITDGEIHDMQETIHKVVKAADLPISIIIVGVGDEDFMNMKHLDGNSGRLVDESGKKCCRDIVQFVKFRDYKNNPNALVSAMLAEVPKQIVEFMNNNRMSVVHQIKNPLKM